MDSDTTTYVFKCSSNNYLKNMKIERWLEGLFRVYMVCNGGQFKDKCKRRGKCDLCSWYIMVDR